MSLSWHDHLHVEEAINFPLLRHQDQLDKGYFVDTEERLGRHYLRTTL